MITNNKAQGTIEYLIIVAIVVVIALVVVNLLLGFLSGTSGISEQTSKTTWASSEPWGMTEWTMSTGGYLTVVLKNNSFETLGFNYITTDSHVSDTNSQAATVAPGATLIRIISTGDSYVAGNRFSIAKSGILIDFNTTNINHRTQYGAADIVGTVG